MGGAWIFVVLVVVAGAAAYLTYYLKEKRRQGMAYAARQLGLAFAPTDPFDTLAESLPLLQRGDGRGVENVLWGTWGGIECRAFDYWYYDESTDSNGNRSHSYHRFSCVLGSVDAACSPLTLTGENVLTRLGDHMGFRDIELESVVQPGVHGDVARSEVRGGPLRRADDAVVAGARGGLRLRGGGRSPAGLLPQARPHGAHLAAGHMKGFREHIPRVVFSLYPKPR